MNRITNLDVKLSDQIYRNLYTKNRGIMDRLPMKRIYNKTLDADILTAVREQNKFQTINRIFK